MTEITTEKKPRKRKSVYRSPSAKSIKALRTAAGWTPQQLAEKLRVGPGSVKAWEAGTSEMPAGYWSLMVVQAVYVISSMEEPKGQDVLNLRLAMGWTQSDFAERAGTSFRRVSGWERDEHRIHPGLWKALRVFLALEHPEHVAV